MTRRQAASLLLALVLLGCSLRLYHLTARSLWFDEAFSWRLIQFPLSEMFARAAQDVHPPLYYLALKAWSAAFFSSLFSLRLFSVVWAAVGIVMSYMVMVEVARSRAAGLAGAALIAFSGFQLQYAWEARMYTMGIALALLTCWLLLKAVRTARPAWWLALALASAAFVYVHYFAVFTLLAYAVFVLGWLVTQTRGRPGELLLQRQTWYALGAAALAAVLYVPWLPTAIQQHARVQGGYWVPPLSGWSVPDTFYRMLAPRAAPPSHSGLGALRSLLPLAVSVIALLLAARQSSRHERDGRLLLCLAFVVPWLGIISVSLLGRSLYQDRFFAFAQPFLLLAIAAAIALLKPRGLRTAAAMAVAAAFLLATFRYWQELDIRHRPGTRAAAQVIAQQRQLSEPIIASSPFIFFPLDFYFTEVYASPDAVKLHADSASPLHFAGTPILVPTDVAQDHFSQSGAASLWVVDTTGFGAQAYVPDAVWQPRFTASFPEVFAYQGSVTATRYVRLP